jgi:glycosyltransferase involved in cell wall biosynthesis
MIGWFRLRRARSLPNVTIWDFQKDVRRIYSLTDILLVPSRNESFGRVIVEAQINGIPVVAAKSGAIPYALGQGGVLIDPADNVQAYIDAVVRLRSDKRHYGNLSKLALENSKRAEFDPECQVHNFIRFVSTRQATPLSL